MAAYQLPRMPISALVALALAGSPRKGLSPALYNRVLCWGNPEGSWGALCMYTPPAGLDPASQDIGPAIRHLGSWPVALQGNQGQSVDPRE